MKVHPDIAAAIEAKRLEWAALTQEERLQRINAEKRAQAAQMEASIAKAQEAQRVSAEKLDGIMEAFKGFARGVEVMTPEQEAEYNWRTRVEPQLASIGVEARHRQRIAPNWHCEPQRKTFEAVRNLCQCTGAVVALVGNRGTGKTTTATQLMRERVEASLATWFDADAPIPFDAGRYAKIQKLAAHFKPLYADFGSRDGETLAERLTNWCKLDLLVLDEIHESEDIKTQMRLLVDLVDRRYSARKDTILISNRDAEQFKAEINPSILSRISEHGGIFPCMWESWRAKK